MQLSKDIKYFTLGVFLMEKIYSNTRENIVLIGPVYPYKGGISHYTGLMCRALGRDYNVTMVSYKFQYPRLLYLSLIHISEPTRHIS